MAAADAGVAVGHVACALLMHHRDKADAGGFENIHRVHEGRAHDAENIGHAMRDQGFNKGFAGSHFAHNQYLKSVSAERESGGQCGLRVNKIIAEFLGHLGVGHAACMHIQAGSEMRVFA